MTFAEFTLMMHEKVQVLNYIGGDVGLIGIILAVGFGYAGYRAAKDDV